MIRSKIHYEERLRLASAETADFALPIGGLQCSIIARRFDTMTRFDEWRSRIET